MLDALAEKVSWRTSDRYKQALREVEDFFGVKGLETGSTQVTYKKHNTWLKQAMKELAPASAQRQGQASVPLSSNALLTWPISQLPLDACRKPCSTHTQLSLRCNKRRSEPLLLSLTWRASSHQISFFLFWSLLFLLTLCCCEVYWLNTCRWS